MCVKALGGEILKINLLHAARPDEVLFMNNQNTKYDIFISFKHTDNNENETEDYRMAKSLYDELTRKGYSVFFSSASLERMGSSRYKADIDNALDSSKAMIVVLTKAEYAVSHWVQYEWDSFYNDFLSGEREAANLFTLTKNVNIHELPRTLRNVQNFNYETGLTTFCNYLKNLFPVAVGGASTPTVEGKRENKIEIISGREVTADDIRQALMLDALAYDEIYHLEIETCLEWFKANPDIYFMAKESDGGRVVAYINVSPVTDECYERLKKGDFIDTGISADMILDYDMAAPYSMYFSSIVVHPQYQNSAVFMQLVNAVMQKFILLGEHGVYIKRMLADAVTDNGIKFCKLFGMNKVLASNHNSTLYEVCMIPPKFRVLSKMTKALKDYYVLKYKEEPYLFDED